MVGTRLAPLLQERRAVPLDYLLAEADRADFTHQQHDMRVRLGLAVLAHVPMHIEVGPPAALDRKSVVWGRKVSVRVDLGGGRIVKKKITTKNTTYSKKK